MTAWRSRSRPDKGAAIPASNKKPRLPEDSGVPGLGGAKGRTRTDDRTIFSRELYQLSYLGEVNGVPDASRAARPVGDKGLEPLTSTV